MISAWKAFITCQKLNPNKAADLHHISNDSGQAIAAAGVVPFHYLPQAFDRATHHLKLPLFMQDKVSLGCPPITLSGFLDRKRVCG